MAGFFKMAGFVYQTILRLPYGPPLVNRCVTAWRGKGSSRGSVENALLSPANRQTYYW